MGGKVGAWLLRHPDVLVVAAGVVMVWSVQTFDRAVAFRTEVKRHAADMAREASEALGG